jgi:type IV secretory pathway VirB6-like protein
MYYMNQKLKQVWNKFVAGFETGVWNLIMLVLGIADDQDVMSLQVYLPSKIGRIFIIIAIIGIILRYFIKVGYIRPFKDENVDNT